MHNGTATAYESFRDKVPPQNLEAESSVLGAVLLEPQCLNDVMALLKAPDLLPRRSPKDFPRVLGDVRTQSAD